MPPAAGAILLRAGAARAKTERPSRPAPTTPDEAIVALKAGNERFVNHTPQVRDTEDIEEKAGKIRIVGSVLHHRDGHGALAESVAARIGRPRGPLPG